MNIETIKILENMRNDCIMKEMIFDTVNTMIKMARGKDVISFRIYLQNDDGEQSSTHGLDLRRLGIKEREAVLSILQKYYKDNYLKAKEKIENIHIEGDLE